jgi:hypothetical protein
MKAVAQLHMDIFTARLKADKVSLAEIKDLATFRKTMEENGYAELFRDALTGSIDAARRLGGLIGKKNAYFTVETGPDGLPDIFAVTADNNNEQTKTSIGHLAAMFAPTVHAASIGLAMDRAKGVSEISYRKGMADAAKTKAEAAQLKAIEEQKLTPLRANLLRAQEAAANRRDVDGDGATSAGNRPGQAISRMLYESSVPGLDGKTQDIPELYANRVSILAWAKTTGGLSGARAEMFADDQLAGIRRGVNAILPEIYRQRMKDLGVDRLSVTQKREFEKSALEDSFSAWERMARAGGLRETLGGYQRAGR